MRKKRGEGQTRLQRTAQRRPAAVAGLRLSCWVGVPISRPGLRSLRLQRHLQHGLSVDNDAAAVSDLHAASQDLLVHSGQRPVLGGRQPQAQQVAPLVRVLRMGGVRGEGECAVSAGGASRQADGDPSLHLGGRRRSTAPGGSQHSAGNSAQRDTWHSAAQRAGARLMVDEPSSRVQAGVVGQELDVPGREHVVHAQRVARRNLLKQLQRGGRGRRGEAGRTQGSGTGEGWSDAGRGTAVH